MNNEPLFVYVLVPIFLFNLIVTIIVLIYDFYFNSEVFSTIIQKVNVINMLILIITTSLKILVNKDTRTFDTTRLNTFNSTF
jgi:hypothetical protein